MCIHKRVTNLEKIYCCYRALNTALNTTCAQHLHKLLYSGAITQNKLFKKESLVTQYRHRNTVGSR